MYSYEIENLIRLKNELLDLKDYDKIILTSPQVKQVKYNDDMFYIATTDNYNFKFKIKRRENYEKGLE